jgi:signal transduction histidine kinase
MHRVELFRSSGFRMAVLFLSIFLTAAAIAGAAAYLVIRDELVSRHQRSVADQYDYFAGLFGAGGKSDLIESLQAHSRADHGKDTVYLLLDGDGNRLAGNIRLAGAMPKTGEIGAADLGIGGDYDYFVRSGPVGDLKLMVGSSGEDVSEVEEVFFEGAFWAALLLTVISLAGGIALSLRMNRRIAAIEHTLENVAQGRFASRIPASGGGDDIDRVGSLINVAVERLGAAVETNRQISSDIAHDLKTPMNRLRISVEKALENHDARRPVDSELEAIDDESRTILATFDALLRIAQIESGARKARFAQVDVGAILAEVTEFYAAYAEDSGAGVDSRIEVGLPTIEGDRELLAQLFANLIENALKHAGQKPHIACSVRSEDDAVVACISDNGPGIPAGEHENVLRRLFRLEKSRTTPGSGLGLSMVKAICDLHGANLLLSDNRPGLVVRITFPLPRIGKTLPAAG